MNYNETRDLIRSLTTDLKVISENFKVVRIMFQTDDEGNPTEEAKSQLYFDYRKVIAKQNLPRDLKELSQKLIDSIPAIKDYIENWCDKPTDPDINSLSLALGNIIDNKSAKIGELVPGYYDFISDCDHSKSLIEKGQAKSQQRNQAPKYPTEEFSIKFQNSEEFKLAKKEGLIDDNLVWKDTLRSLVDFLWSKGLVKSVNGQIQWRDVDRVFSWEINRGENKGQIIRLSKEKLRAAWYDFDSYNI